MNLTDAEKKVFSSMLDYLENAYSNAGCNDMVIDDLDIQQAVADWRNSEDPDAKFAARRINYDFIVLHYFRQKLGL